MLAFLLLRNVCHAQETNTNQSFTKTPEDTMPAKENITVIRKLFEESLNKSKLQFLKELVSDEYSGPGGKNGAAGFEQPFTALIAAFPDIHYTIEELVAEGDKVVVRWTWKGTHTGKFQQFGATGKKITNDGMAIFELKQGKIIKSFVQTDRLGFLQQLEAVPLDLALLSKETQNEYVYFIDKFLVPAQAKPEFLQRANINRNYIKTLPGFIEDAAYECNDEQGNMVYITIAVWKNEESLSKAKEAVQAEYKKQGFNPAAMLERLHITMDRGIYREDTLLP